MPFKIVSLRLQNCLDRNPITKAVKELNPLKRRGCTTVINAYTALSNRTIRRLRGRPVPTTTQKSCLCFLGITSIPKKRGIRGPKFGPQKSRTGPFYANPALFFCFFSFLGQPLLKKKSQTFLVQGHFLHCQWRDASIAEICLSKSIFHPQFFCLTTDPFWCLVSLLPKTQTKFWQNSNKNSNKNLNKIQTCLRRPNHF